MTYAIITKSEFEMLKCVNLQECKRETKPLDNHWVKLKYIK